MPNKRMRMRNSGYKANRLRMKMHINEHVLERRAAHKDANPTDKQTKGGGKCTEWRP